MTDNNAIMANEEAVNGFEDEKAVPATESKVEKISDTQFVSKNKGLKVCVVADCQKLRVRKGPSLEAEVLTIIEKDKHVLVDRDVPEENGFVKVALSSGLEGYCMSKFIKNAGE